MKVLISGGAGFIGSNLALKLFEKGYDVVILDNLSKQIHGENPNQSFTYNLIKDKFEFIKGDVTNFDDWRRALKDVDIVVHLAAETGTGQSMYEINRYVDVNIGGTAKLMEILTNEKNRVRKVIVASSRAVYGEGKYKCSEHGIVFPLSRKDEDMKRGDFEVKCPICRQNVDMLPTDEEAKLHPESVYGYTKQSQEELCMIVGRSINIPVVAFRFQNVYGPGQSLKNPYTGILSIFSTRIKNGNDINIFEDGLESRDFVYIDDVTDAIVLGIENDKANFEAFNVGSGEKIEVLSIAKILKEKYNSDVKIHVTGNYRLGDIRHNLGDLTKIRSLLGYEPKFNFDKGITNFVDWVEEQAIEKDNYENSIEEMKRKGLYK
ncbi:NAD-dependent epimerase/dehydratase family protein [Acetivibrio clariflavus]|uniref:Nucleoside-diphosphate-sugar epimerase n=1 Tax=Acetivibrio clariflavus (strain DSM 19732 / NBRC 101661 / EBR45) TaxID=720554 RepID=G8LUH5_ACECE|nr:SDR family NAD(P)-dependent oxidoreductase [Acetivibrio clariflavus]AEV70623.1 nucleoside-diphosphate-sugar epimerase [Acetivibrio clariflavus DSM 19732]